MIKTKSSRSLVIDSLYGYGSIGYTDNGKANYLISKIKKSSSNGNNLEATVSLKSNGDYESPNYFLSNTSAKKIATSVSFSKNKITKEWGARYTFFRNDIFPCWEDPMNTNGFEYSIKNGNDLKKLDSEWMECILYLIGDEDPIMCHINGIRMVDCTKYSSVLYRMEIWIDNEKYKSDIEKVIKDKFKDIDVIGGNIATADAATELSLIHI